MFLRVNAPRQQGSPRIRSPHPYRPLQERVLAYDLVLDAIQTLGKRRLQRYSGIGMAARL